MKINEKENYIIIYYFNGKERKLNLLLFSYFSRTIFINLLAEIIVRQLQFFLKFLLFWFNKPLIQF